MNAQMLATPLMSSVAGAGRALLSRLPFGFEAEFEPDFRAIVECSANAVIVTDPDLEMPGPTIRFVNAALTRLSGYAAQDAIRPGN